MGEEQYPNNSHKYREEQNKSKNLSKVVTSEVTVKKKSGFRGFLNNFVSEDAGSVGSFLVNEVLIPGIQSIIYNGGVGILDNLFPNANIGTARRRSSIDNVSYRSFYDRNRDRDRDRDTRSSRPKNMFDFDDIIIRSKGEAELILDKMYDILDRYHVVSVGDFYELVGIDTHASDYNYGWMNLHNGNCRVIRSNGGYLIDLPKALPIE